MGKILIDIQQGKLTLHVQEDGENFNIFEAIKYPMDNENCFRIDIVNKLMMETFREGPPMLQLEACIIHSDTYTKEDHVRRECVNYVEVMIVFTKKEDFMEPTNLPSTLVPSKQGPLKFELKELHSHTRYAILGDKSTLQVIIFSSLTEKGEEKLFRVLWEQK